MRGRNLLPRILTIVVIFVAIVVFTIVLIVAAVVVVAVFVIRASGFLPGFLFFALFFRLKEFSFLARTRGSLGLPG